MNRESRKPSMPGSEKPKLRDQRADDEFLFDLEELQADEPKKPSQEKHQRGSSADIQFEQNTIDTVVSMQENATKKAQKEAATELFKSNTIAVYLNEARSLGVELDQIGNLRTDLGWMKNGRNKKMYRKNKSAIDAITAKIRKVDANVQKPMLDKEPIIKFKAETKQTKRKGLAKKAAYWMQGIAFAAGFGKGAIDRTKIDEGKNLRAQAAADARYVADNENGPEINFGETTIVDAGTKPAIPESVQSFKPIEINPTKQAVKDTRPVTTAPVASKRNTAGVKSMFIKAAPRPVAEGAKESFSSERGPETPASSLLDVLKGNDSKLAAEALARSIESIDARDNTPEAIQERDDQLSGLIDKLEKPN